MTAMTQESVPTTSAKTPPRRKETEAATDFRFSILIFWEQKNRPSVISNWNFIADCLLSSNACP